MKQEIIKLMLDWISNNESIETTAGKIEDLIENDKIAVGKYELSKLDSQFAEVSKKAGQTDVIWLQHESGEGTSINLDDLFEKFM